MDVNDAFFFAFVGEIAHGSVGREAEVISTPLHKTVDFLERRDFNIYSEVTSIDE